jgi:manganese transport protein
MSAILEVTLGILTAVGGFIDIGELVFSTQAGAKFGYGLLWAVVIGAIMIAIYAEMSGRVATVTQKAAFVLIKEKFGFTIGLGTLIASNLLNILTCAAEIGGVAFVLRLLSGIPYGLGISIALLSIIAIVYFLPFKMIEKVFGIMGLFMLVFVVAAVYVQPEWRSVATGLIPHVPKFSNNSDLLLYLYFAVGIIGSTIMPYEVYFYSSGNIEEERKPKELPINALTSVVGFSFGSIVSMSLIILGTQIFLPHNISPEVVGTSLITTMIPFGAIGILTALLGLFFAIGGASIETCFAGAYNFSQFFDWSWGKQKPPLKVPRFTLSWIFIFLMAIVILVTGLDPLKLTEYAVIFSVIVLPLTYLPILLVANDKKYMGKYANNSAVKIIGAIAFIIICIIALAAVPLMYLTHAGQG